MIQAWPFPPAKRESTAGFFKNSYWFTLHCIAKSDRFAVGRYALTHSATFRSLA